MIIQGDLNIGVGIHDYAPLGAITICAVSGGDTVLLILTTDAMRELGETLIRDARLVEEIIEIRNL